MNPMMATPKSPVFSNIHDLFVKSNATAHCTCSHEVKPRENTLDLVLVWGRWAAVVHQRLSSCHMWAFASTEIQMPREG